MPRIMLSEQAFDPYAELRGFHAQLGERVAQLGAQSIFIGSMRDFNEGTSVERLWLEHYPGMTERQLAMIVEQACQRWGIQECLVIHRVGDIRPGDAIVLIAFWSAHRAAALDATRHVIEELKHKAPFWKKESWPEGYRWVERNTPG